MLKEGTLSRSDYYVLLDDKRMWTEAIEELMEDVTVGMKRTETRLTSEKYDERQRDRFTRRLDTCVENVQDANKALFEARSRIDKDKLIHWNKVYERSGDDKAIL